VRGRLISQLDSLLMLLPAAAALVLLTPVDTTAMDGQMAGEQPPSRRVPAGVGVGGGFRRWGLSG
jgi:hypothetical protein